MSEFLVYILKVASLTAIFVILYHLLLRRDTFHRTTRMVLVSSLIISYVLPFCVITVHKPMPASESPETTVVSAQTNYQTQPSLQQQTQNPMPAQIQVKEEPQIVKTVLPERKQIDWILIAITIYLIGTTCLILLRLMSIHKVCTLIRQGRVVMRRDDFKIVVSKENIRPFSWMNYIVLPEGYVDISCTSAVIRHEFSHVSHHHSIELMAIDILSAFQWFNPAVWLLRHDLCCVQEFQADASVLESGVDRMEYQKTLLGIAIGGLSIPLVNGLGESSLRSRIKMMNRKLSGKGNILKIIYLPSVVIAALVLMSNTVYDIANNTSASPVNDVQTLEEPTAYDEPVKSDDIPVSDSEYESPLSDNEPVESDLDDNLETDETETTQTMLARLDGSLLESQMTLPSYQDNKVMMPQSLPETMLDSLIKQYPELNSIESIYDDGILTNDKPYKGYISCIQLSKGVYSFWVMELNDKDGKVVSIELGTIDDAIAFLEKLVSSYKQGNTVSAQGHMFTAVKGNAYSTPRTDGVDPDHYLISVKNLNHDLSVLEKRKSWGTATFDEIAFFNMENKPDHYEFVGKWGANIIYDNIYVNTYEDCGEANAAIQIEKLIRERASEGHTPGFGSASERFNGVILVFPLQKHYVPDRIVERFEYRQYYIPINYDPEKYQAPLTDYQRSLKRSVFRRKKK